MALCHEDIRGSGGMASTILDFGTRWGRVLSFMPCQLYPRGDCPSDTCRIGGWVVPQMDLDTVGKIRELILVGFSLFCYVEVVLFNCVI
jgi:hypothetical protein